jgi:hypothetical protein
VVLPKKRIVGLENIVEEEEYNQFDKMPFFDTSYKPRLLGTNKTPYLRSDCSEKNPYTKIMEEKASLIYDESFCNVGCVYWWKWKPFCNIYRM